MQLTPPPLTSLLTPPPLAGLDRFDANNDVGGGGGSGGMDFQLTAAGDADDVGAILSLEEEYAAVMARLLMDVGTARDAVASLEAMCRRRAAALKCVHVLVCLSPFFHSPGIVWWRTYLVAHTQWTTPHTTCTQAADTRRRAPPRSLHAPPSASK
jgi:hypothetical protein